MFRSVTIRVSSFRELEVCDHRRAAQRVLTGHSPPVPRSSCKVGWGAVDFTDERMLLFSLVSTRPGYVFISYKREEAAIADRLRQALVGEGFGVWWDQELQCGQGWAEALDKAVREAGCIVVLWSEVAVTSPWVRHEASQAMVREVYAPARIHLVRLGSPYDRLQVTDLLDWQGEREHAGFRTLIKRIDELLPEPIPLVVRVGRWLGENIATLVASAIAIGALSL